MKTRKIKASWSQIYDLLKEIRDAPVEAETSGKLLSFPAAGIGHQRALAAGAFPYREIESSDGRIRASLMEEEGDIIVELQVAAWAEDELEGATIYLRQGEWQKKAELEEREIGSQTQLAATVKIARDERKLISDTEDIRIEVDEADTDTV